MLRWLALALTALAVVVCPRLARADESTAHSVSVAVLALDSDDAEEQADALTGALRSRIRASQGWSLIETSQSLGMLTAALRCTNKPISADCEQRIAEQLKTDRYIFGYVTRGPQANQVTAEIHLYQKSEPDTVVRESYAANLKDQNDDTLRGIAERLVGRLGGSAVGTLVIRAGSETGEVVIDGTKRIPLERGTARLDLSPGGHSVEVDVPGQPPQKRNVLVTVGKETLVDLTLAAQPGAGRQPERKPFPTRKVVGAGLALAGAALGAVAIINWMNYNDDQDKGHAYNNSSGNDQDKALRENEDLGDICDSPQRPHYQTMCRLDDDSTRHSTIAWTTGATGAVLLGVGTYLLLTGSSSGSDADAPSSGKAKRPTLTPTFGRSSAGFVLSGSF